MSEPDSPILDWLAEIEDFLEDQQDVLDGADGPRPNRAMQLLTEMQRLRLTRK